MTEHSEQQAFLKPGQTRTRRHGARVSAAWLGARTIAVLGALPFALRYVPVARIVAWLTPVHPPTQQRPELLYPCARWVDRLVDRRPFRFWGHCLRRSLALYYVARRSGYPAVIVFGIQRDGGSGVIGHGWLELADAAFLEPGEPPETRFVVMYRLPAGPPSARPAQPTTA